MLYEINVYTSACDDVSGMKTGCRRFKKLQTDEYSSVRISERTLRVAAGFCGRREFEVF